MKEVEVRPFVGGERPKKVKLSWAFLWSLNERGEKNEERKKPQGLLPSSMPTPSLPQEGELEGKRVKN